MPQVPLELFLDPFSISAPIVDAGERIDQHLFFQNVRPLSLGGDFVFHPADIFLESTHSLVDFGHPGFVFFPFSLNRLLDRRQAGHHRLFQFCQRFAEIDPLTKLADFFFQQRVELRICLMGFPGIRKGV